MTGMTIDWGSLGLVTAVTVLGTAFILIICSLAARMMATVHAKYEAGEVEGVGSSSLTSTELLLASAESAAPAHRASSPVRGSGPANIRS